jgi:hypothetical protein
MKNKVNFKKAKEKRSWRIYSNPDPQEFSR